MDKEALKLALEALETYHGYMEPLLTVFGGPRVPAEKSTTYKVEKAITAIKEALREHAMYEVQRLGQEIQPEQEPVTLPCCGYTDASAIKWNPYNQVVQCHNCGQVYTTPPQRTWVGLTDEEKSLFSSWLDHKTDDEVFSAIEAKLKEKNA